MLPYWNVDLIFSVECEVLSAMNVAGNRLLVNHWRENLKSYITVACLLKARTVEPEKQPLLANGSETTFVYRQRPLNKQRNNVRF
jgi:hypothetical protein